MDRRALIVYLQNVRDLEFAKWKIEQIYAQKEAEFNQNKVYYNTSTYYQLPDADSYKNTWEKFEKEANVNKHEANLCLVKTVAIILIFIVIIYFLYPFILMFHHFFDGSGVVHLVEIVIWGYVVAFIFGIYLNLHDEFYIGFSWVTFYKKKANKEFQNANEIRQNYKDKFESIEQYNRAEKARTKDFPQLLKKEEELWKQNKDYFNAEKAKVERMLKNAYALNIIPLPYRYNLSAIQYIYEYMASSEESLTTALHSQQLKEGIELISSRIDDVLAEVQEVVVQNRCMINEISSMRSRLSEMSFQLDEVNSNYEKIGDINMQILESNRRNEANTADAARAASMAANYAEASAYFGLANYLKD